MRKRSPQAMPWTARANSFCGLHLRITTSIYNGARMPSRRTGIQFVQILERLWWKLDRASDEDITFCPDTLIECIRNGTTTVIDHHASPAMREGSGSHRGRVRQAGIRASVL
jgi:hypothetical protein